MENNLEKIKEIISASDLSEEEKNEFIAVLSGAKEEELASLAGIFAEDSSWVRKMYENYKAKKAAFASGDEKMAEEILKHEEEELEKIKE